MKQNILMILMALLLGIGWLLLKKDSNYSLENEVKVSENNVKKMQDSKYIVDENNKSEVMLKEVVENNISNDFFLKVVEELISNRESKEFNDFFTLDTYEDNTGNVIGSYKVGMLEEVFEQDQLNLPFFNTYQTTVISKSIDPSGYIQIDANLEGDEDGYLGLVENKKSKVLSGVLYDYQGGVEYHIEGKNGQFKIFPIKENTYIHDDVLPLTNEKIVIN